MTQALEFFKTMLASDAGTFGFVLAFLLFIFWAYGKILKIIHDHGTFSGRVEKIERDIDAMRTDIVTIKGNMNFALASLSGAAQTRSPVSLTDKGVGMADDIGAEKIIAQNWESRIFPVLDKNVRGKNPYDIQEFCFGRVLTDPALFFDNAAIEKMKTTAYEKGETLYAYLQVLGILMRDAYLRHIRCEVSDVDKFAPK